MTESDPNPLTVITIRRHVEEDGTSSVTAQVGHGAYNNAQEVATAILMSEHAIEEMKAKFFGVSQVTIARAEATVIKKKGPKLTDSNGNPLSTKP
jgi:hypothetical protein